MAITAPQLQAELGTKVTDPRVTHELPPYGGSSQYWRVSGGMTYKGRNKRIATTASDNAATQAAAVLVLLAAGPTA